MKHAIHALSILSAVLLIGFGASADTPATLVGDVNGDGAINVLDVQAAVVQALHVVAQTAQADVDGSAEVDITDIQNLINTSLGTGGLVQRLQGTLAAAADLLQRGIHLAAVSQDGDQVSATVDTATGAFSITLPVKKEWALVFVTEADSTGAQDSGTVEFTVDGNVSELLPLTDLSHCDIMDLGTLNFGGRIRAPKDLRDILGSVNLDKLLVDENGNQIPDAIDTLLARIAALPDVGMCSGEGEGEGGPPPLPIPCFHFPDLVASSTPCIQGAFENLAAISLVYGDMQGIPRFLDPVLNCLKESVIAWLKESGVPVILPGPEVFLNMTRPLIPVWLASLNLPGLTDNNGNNIPDILEPFLGRHDLPPAVDANGNGIPDFLEPHHHGGEGEGEGEGEPAGEVVPDVVGMTLTDAKAAITDAGLVLGGIGHKFSDTVPVDQVLAQRPEAGKTIPKGAPVNIEVSLGKQPEPVTVPNVAGLAQADAEAAITAAGLTVGAEMKRPSATVAEGLVMEQLPEAGRKVPPKAPVNLLISSGPSTSGGAGA